MSESNQISIFRYVLTNPKFTKKDKLQFFGFFVYFLFLIFIGVIIILGPKIFLILLVFFTIFFLKALLNFAKKFVIPYEEFRGRKEVAKSLEKKLEYLIDRQKIGLKYSWDFPLLILIAMGIIILIPILFPKIISKIISSPPSLIPIGFLIVFFLLLALILYQFPTRYIPYYQELKRTAQKYHVWSTEKVLIFLAILIISFFLLFLFFEIISYYF